MMNVNNQDYACLIKVGNAVMRSRFFSFYMLTKVKLATGFVQFQKIVVPLQRFF